MTQSGIYSIINLINGKLYIGSAKHLPTRQKRHFSELRANKHHSNRLQYAFNKYGEDAFIFTVLEYVDDISQLLKREQVHLDEFQSFDDECGYNICRKADSWYGNKHTDITRQKISQNNKGRPAHNKGKPMSEEQRLRLSQQMTGRPAHNKGKPMSEEQKQKLKGRRRSGESRQKMSESAKLRCEREKLESPDAYFAKKKHAASFPNSGRFQKSPLPCT